MPVRQPYALNFYESECRTEQIELYLKGFQVPQKPTKVVGGIVPHAGWMYSGVVAAKVFRCIKEKAHPDTFILFGAVHSWNVHRNSIYDRGSWITPMGKVEVDDEIADALLIPLKNELVVDSRAHFGEHSLEVQLPFIKYFFPQAKIVPIMIIPDKSSAFVGQRTGEVVANSTKEIVVVGTTDLTHYGDDYMFAPQGYGPKALEWLEENDMRIITLATDLRAEDIVEEAFKNHNACGSGAIAATVSAAKVLGAEQGVLVEYTTSYHTSHSKEFHMGVGYAGIVF